MHAAAYMYTRMPDRARERARPALRVRKPIMRRNNSLQVKYKLRNCLGTNCGGYEKSILQNWIGDFGRVLNKSCRFPIHLPLLLSIYLIYISETWYINLIIRYYNYIFSNYICLIYYIIKGEIDLFWCKTIFSLDWINTFAHANSSKKKKDYRSWSKISQLIQY